MHLIWQIIAEIASNLHPDRTNAIARRIEHIEKVDQFEEINSYLRGIMGEETTEVFHNSWKDAGELEGRSLASAFKAAAATSIYHDNLESSELVWTGPTTCFVPVRSTEQVLQEIIELAEKRIFLVSFVAYKVESILHALKRATKRGIHIDILVESSIEHGGRVSADSVLMFKHLLPSASVYIWRGGDESSVASTIMGCVHAKCAVADGNVALITSANISDAAMEKNMELGVLIRGGQLPAELHRHLDALVSEKIVQKVLKSPK